MTHSAALAQSEIARLRDQVEEQAETIRQLREALAKVGGALPWVGWLTPSHRKILSVLLTRRHAAMETLSGVLYCGRTHPPSPATIAVLMHQLRRKLVERGVAADAIATITGFGYELRPEHAGKIRELVGDLDVGRAA